MDDRKVYYAQGMGIMVLCAPYKRGHIMSLPNEARNLISGYVSQRKADYNQLSFHQKCELQAAIRRGISKLELDSLLSDYDDGSLSNIVTDLLYREFSQSYIEILIDKIKQQQVTGQGSGKPPFWHDIKEQFENEWQDQWPKECGLDFKNDFEMRTRDLRAQGY